MLYRPQKRIMLGKISTSEKEIKDILKAWIAISLAFSFLLTGISAGSLVVGFAVAFLTVGIGFLFHELAHKIVAQRYGCEAEFRSFDSMLVLAVVLAFVAGFVFAAPGAVMIRGPVGKRRNGMISVAGPVTNIVLALLFLLLLLVSPGTGIMALIGHYGFLINTWLALFNMLPFWQLDGAKVWAWHKGVYWTVVGITVALMVVQYTL